MATPRPVESRRSLEVMGDAGEDVGKTVVKDLIQYLFDPSSTHIPSSFKSIISLDLLIDFPYAPQPVPIPVTPYELRIDRSHHVELAARAATLQALSLFRLPTLAVNLLPGAEWQLEVRRIAKSDSDVIGSPAVPAELTILQASSTMNPSGLVETWTAEIRWRLSFGIFGGRQPSRRIEPERPLDAAEIAPLSEEPFLWSKISKARIVELVFAPKPLDPVEAQGRREKEQVVSSDQGEFATLRSSTFSGHVGGRAGSSGVLVRSEQDVGFQLEKVKPTRADDLDEPLQPLQLAHARYRLPPSRQPFGQLSFVPSFARSRIRSLLFTLLEWVLPLAFAFLQYFHLDASHVLSTHALHRTGTSHKYNQGKSKERRSSSTSSRCRRRSLSASAALLPASSLPLQGIPPPSSIDTVTLGEEQALARIASLSSEREGDSTMESRGRHPKHLGRTRCWSSSTPAAERRHACYEGRQAEGRKGEGSVITHAALEGQSLFASLVDICSSTLEGVRGAEQATRNLAWAIRRLVILFLQLLLATFDVLRELLFPAVFFAMSDGDQGLGGERPQGLKRR
ncbi:hypothetical protein JCM11641_008399 [Rhodosporidiobolus odoratus]